MLDFKRRILDNGLTVLFEKRDFPIVSIGYGVKYGSANDLAKDKGMAHFIEHLIFGASNKMNFIQIAKEIEGRGGILNAYTYNESTIHFCTIPENHYKRGLEILTDIIQNPIFDRKKFENEKKIILSEIKQVNFLDEFLPQLYQGTLKLPGTGTEKTVESLKLKNLAEKFESFYTPDNMFLSVVGNADFDYICSYAEKNIMKKTGLKAPNPRAIRKPGKRIIEKISNGSQSVFIFGFHSIYINHPKKYALYVLMSLMGGGASSRLHNEIRNKRGLAYEVGAALELGSNFGYGLVYAETDKEKISQIESIVLKEFEKASKNISRKEIEEKKEELIGNNLIFLESSGERMISLINSEIHGGDMDSSYLRNKFSKVSAEEVMELAKIKDPHILILTP